jgi:hypothetical protein
MNQIEEPGKAKRRGKRGGKKHKDAAAKLAEVASVENVVEGAILPGKNEATLQSKVEITAAQADEKKQLPHLSYDTKSYFCTLESKLDDPEALEGTSLRIINTSLPQTRISSSQLSFVRLTGRKSQLQEILTGRVFLKRSCL